MKLKKLIARAGLAAVLLSTLNSQLSTALAQGTAFTYQGRLDIAGVPASGTNDLTFTLYTAVTAGATVGTSNTVNDLVITNGLFTVTLDFGAGAFNGAARWLQIAARPGVSTGAYTNLAPRQAITPSPYAVFAGGAAAAGVTGTLPASALSGAYSGSVNLSNAANSFAGNGAGLTSLNASNLTSGTVADARLSANVALRSGGNTFNGTQTLQNNLVVNGVHQGFGELQLWAQEGLGSDGTAYVQARDNTGTSSIALQLRSQNAGVVNNALKILPNGNVGIGTTTPSAQLDVRGPSTLVGGIALGDYNITNSRYIGIIAPGQPADIATDSGFSGIEFGGPAGNTNSGLIAFHTHSFGSGSSERMRIDKSGNVGIGTTTPNFPLSFPNSGGEKISLYGQDTNSIHGFGIGGNRMEFYVPSTGHSFVFGVGNNANFAEKARISGDGSINVAASATIGSSGRLHIQSRAGQPLYLNPFVGGTDVIIGGGGANPNLVLSGGEVTCTAVNITSDRNAKEQFKPVSPREVLAKVAALPITEWQYKTQGDARHIGPMAQDFRAAFGTGRDDKHITSVDADGVALAAIQGLNEKLEDEVRNKDRRIDALQKSVEELKALVNKLAVRDGGAR